jgi:hypothetical protein
MSAIAEFSSGVRWPRTWLKTIAAGEIRCAGRNYQPGTYVRIQAITDMGRDMRDSRV